MNIEGHLVILLQAILDAELAQGNSIREVGEWLPHCELLVILKHRFFADYTSLPHVAYQLINDPHYWYAEYALDNGRQTIACGFA